MTSKLIFPAVGALLGGVSAFAIFAMAFNGFSWTFQLGLFLLTAAGSAAAVRCVSWKRICAAFYLPHLLLFALLLIGSLEKGGWIGNLTLIALPTLAIWLPAWLVSRRAENR
jgi:hypothetical protein